MKLFYRLLILGLLVFLLVLVRLFEHELFYDPLIDYYRYGGYLSGEVPQVDILRLMLNLTFRFWLNSGISLLILLVAFLDRNILGFATLLYVIAFILGSLTFLLIFQNLDLGQQMNLFYVRRFLIHPVLILILLPAFYYYRIQQHARRN